MGLRPNGLIIRPKGFVLCVDVSHVGKLHFKLVQQ
jgi:hypothetical protein